MRLTRNDRYLIGAAAIAACVFFLIALLRPKAPELYIEIYQSNQLLERLPMGSEKTIRLEAPVEGINVIEIKKDSVCVTDSDCPDHLCELMGEIHSNGELIVCLPHELVITITGDAAPVLDGVAQ